MTFEEWWRTKDYPARCKGNCMEAFNAGLHADVHTDNSKVIAEKLFWETYSYEN